MLCKIIKESDDMDLTSLPDGPKYGRDPDTCCHSLSVPCGLLSSFQMRKLRHRGGSSSRGLP